LLHHGRTGPSALIRAANSSFESDDARAQRAFRAKEREAMFKARRAGEGEGAAKAADDYE
jgi:hypothetical protein